MRYPSDHKARARQALVEAGARSLKAAGFNGIGINDLAAAAGVTSGAFYSNFPNKASMLEAVIDAFVGEPFVSDTDSVTPVEGRSRLKDLVEAYISLEHSADPADGCPMPALSADVSRAQPSVKEAYERRISALANRIANLLDGEPSDRERRAWSIVALMVGSLTISRAMPENSEAKSTSLDAARATAGMLVESDPA
ncbi:MAG: TetR/AcrR family transcriptional regulator [Mycobacterium sp.]|uniref:TetR/AcrR family transcriptional regulator n=1 Tax=Mycobacterium sp. TaxID=1785 RepID=UPI003CC66463